jgi:DnaJ-class molecular chaperone
MTDKQSLYELLGLTTKASPEDIRNTHATLRRALDDQPDSEESTSHHDLNGTRDVLLDRRQRAGDHRERDGGSRARRLSPPKAGRHGVVLTLLLLAGLAIRPGTT